MAKCAISGTLEGRPVNIQRDSACSQSAVTASLVSPDLYIPGKTVTLRGIGGEFTFSIALMNLDCMLVSGKVEIAVINGFPMDVLLGHDLDSTCGDILKKELFVLTRAQARKEIDDFVQAEQNLFELQGELTDLFQDDTVSSQVMTDGQTSHHATVDNHSSLPLEVSDEHDECNVATDVSSIPANSPTNHQDGVAVTRVNTDSIPDITSSNQKVNKQPSYLEVDRETLVQLQQTDQSLAGIRDSS